MEIIGGGGHKTKFMSALKSHSFDSILMITKRKDPDMPKKKLELKADIVVKNYWHDNEHFADLFNAVLFQGKTIIRPEELEDLDTEESSILEHRRYAESIQASRDNIKARKKSSVHGVTFVLLGNEGQEHIHYAMPMRVMGYDYGTYKKQYESNAKKYRSAGGLEEDEYLSRMKKADRFVPVITLVVYYGEKPWDGATSLHGMLNLEKEMIPFVNDYKLLLVEARQNNLKLHNIDNVNLFNLLEILLDTDKTLAETKERAIKYAREYKVDKSVVITVAGATNCNIDYMDLDSNGGGDIMCTVFEKNREEGKTEGIIEGRAEGIIETGFEFGLSEKDILERLQKKLNIPLQKAQEYFNMFIHKQTIS